MSSTMDPAYAQDFLIFLILFIFLYTYNSMPLLEYGYLGFGLTIRNCDYIFVLHPWDTELVKKKNIYIYIFIFIIYIYSTWFTWCLHVLLLQKNPLSVVWTILCLQYSPCWNDIELYSWVCVRTPWHHAGCSCRCSRAHFWPRPSNLRY